MKLNHTKTQQGISASAWQALERAAETRRSAATVLRLLTKLFVPVAAGSRSVSTDRSSRVALDAGNPTSASADGAPFEQWAALADAYAVQFLRLQRGDASARSETTRLSREMLRMNEQMKCRA
jgi:hypothetical protein